MCSENGDNDSSDDICIMICYNQQTTAKSTLGSLWHKLQLMQVFANAFTE